MKKQPLIVGVSGASGAPLAVELLKQLKATSLESNLILTSSAQLTIPSETGLSLEEFRSLADIVYDID